MSKTDPSKALKETFELLLDEYVASQPVTVMIMGPDLLSKKISASLRRKLVDLCNREGLAVIAEHKEMIEIGQKKLKAGCELTLYEHAVAVISDLVILIPDSAGSMAELGYFAACDGICEKMIIFFDREALSPRRISHMCGRALPPQH